MKPEDEMRALTCHCGRIACRHHTEAGAQMSTPKTHITFIDKAGGGPTHKVQGVLVNGVEVLVAKDGIEIEYGDDVATAVTLKILPATISFE